MTSNQHYSQQPLFFWLHDLHDGMIAAVPCNILRFQSLVLIRVLLHVLIIPFAGACSSDVVL